MSWQNYILPGDLLATTQEVDIAGVNLQAALTYILYASKQHEVGDFEESRKLVNLAIDRLADWERSDNEMQAAHKRYLDDVNARRQVVETVERLNKQGYDVKIVDFGRKAQ